MAATCSCVLTTAADGNPIANIDIELIRTDTMAIVQVVQTNKHGEASFTTAPPAPCFFRPRIIGKNWNLQVTKPPSRWSLYDRLVDPTGLGTDLTILAAIAALPLGGTIGVVSGDYHETATLYLAANLLFVIEGIGHGIIEDIAYIPAMGVQIHNPIGAGGFDDEIFTLAGSARLTLRGVEVHQDRNYAAIIGASPSYIILEDSYVHADGTASAIDSSYFIRLHRSVVVAAGNEAIEVGTTIIYLEGSESRITGSTYAFSGSFSQTYFEKCQLSKIRCHTTTAASKLRVTDCKVAGGTAGVPGIKVTGGGHDDIQIFDNEIDGDSGHAVEIGYTTLDTAERYQVNNNRLKSTGGHGIHIAGYVKGLTACGNVYSGPGYCIETANALYPENAVFGCNTQDGSAAGVYGPTLSSTTYGAHALLDGLMNSDTLAGAVLDGDIIIGTVTPKWSRLPISIPAAGVTNFLGVANGELRPSWKSDVGYMLLSGTRALTGNWNPGVFTIGNYDFTARPVILYVGDVTYAMSVEAGGPVITFDSGFDFFGYVRASNYFTFVVGGVEYLRVSTTSILAAGAMRVGSLTSPSNVAAGDLTVARLFVGADAVITAGCIVDIIGQTRISTNLLVDHILECNGTHGVDIDGVLCKDDAVEANAIRGMRETTGPTDLTIGNITDGQYLKRVGATIVSGTPAGGSGGFQDAFFLV